MSKRRIKVVQQVLDPSGSGGVSAEYRALANSSLQNEFVFEPMILENPHNGVNVKDILFYYRFLRNACPDIVHVRGAAPDGLNAIIAAKLVGKSKVLVSVHGMYSDLVYIHPIKKWISYHIVEHLTFSLSDGISCVCQYAHNRKRFDKYREKMLPYVYNRIPNYSKYDKTILREHVRSELQIPDKASVGAYVGRVTREKGLDYLKRALERISDDIIILIVGDGDYCQEFKSIGKHNVIFLGNQNEVYPYLFASDFFIQPSLHENHSIALLEATSAGLPIIATCVGGNEEIVKDQVNGLIINPKDSDGLLNAINLLSRDSRLRDMFKQNAINLDVERFGNDAVDKQLSTVYKKLLEKQ